DAPRAAGGARGARARRPRPRRRGDPQDEGAARALDEAEAAREESLRHARAPRWRGYLPVGDAREHAEGRRPGGQLVELRIDTAELAASVRVARLDLC